MLVSYVQPDTHLIFKETIGEVRKQLRGRLRDVFDSAVYGSAIDSPKHPTSIRLYESICRKRMRNALGLHRVRRTIKPPHHPKKQNEIPTPSIKIRDSFLFRKTVSEILSDGFKKIGIGTYRKNTPRGATVVQTCKHVYDPDKFCLVRWENLDRKDVPAVLT